MRRFGTLPLMHQPGEGWMYNTGSLIQGVLVRRAANQPFDAFVRERITGPLGMRDTDFFVPANKLDRYAGCGFFHRPRDQGPAPHGQGRGGERLRLAPGLPRRSCRSGVDGGRLLARLRACF